MKDIYLTRWQREPIHVDSTERIFLHHPRISSSELAWLLPHAPPGHLFIQTSGSQGVPKWVAISFAAMVASAKAVVDFYGLSREDRWLCPLPIYHIGGAAIIARSFVQGSEPYFLEGKWSSKAFIDSLQETRATISSVVPTQLYDLVVENQKPPSSLQHLMVGGSALSHRLENEGRKLGWPIRKTYGMSETASQIASQKEEGKELTLLPHLQVKVDQEQSLFVSGSSLFTGYITPKGLSAPHIDGWFKTEDRAKLEPSSMALMPLGRQDGGVKISGRLVHLTSIEQVIEEVLLEQRLPNHLFVRLQEDLRRGHTLALHYMEPYPESAIVEIKRRLPPWVIFSSISPLLEEASRKGTI